MIFAGGYTVSTACFAFLTRQLRQLAGGNLVLALEGGYNLEVLKTASEQCLRALLNLPIEKISEDELARRPCPPAVETLQKTLAIQSAYWGETLKTNGQDNNVLSHMEAWQKERETSAATTAAETLPAAAAGSIGDLTALSGMASLSMKHHHRVGGGARPPNLNASTSGSEERESTASPDHNMATT